MKEKDNEHVIESNELKACNKTCKQTFNHDVFGLDKQTNFIPSI